MATEIKQRKIVPDKPGHVHRGKQASLAIDSDGYRAWGFGDTKVEADKNACIAVCELRK